MSQDKDENFSIEDTKDDHAGRLKRQLFVAGLLGNQTTVDPKLTSEVYQKISLLERYLHDICCDIERNLDESNVTKASNDFLSELYSMHEATKNMMLGADERKLTKVTYCSNYETGSNTINLEVGQVDRPYVALYTIDTYLERLKSAEELLNNAPNNVKGVSRLFGSISRLIENIVSLLFCIVNKNDFKWAQTTMERDIDKIKNLSITIKDGLAESKKSQDPGDLTEQPTGLSPK